MANDMIEKIKAAGYDEETAYGVIEAIKEPTQEVLDKINDARELAGTSFDVYRAAIDEILRRPKHYVLNAKTAGKI